MTRPKTSSMLVLGLMAGTSTDGIDVALVRFPGARPVRTRPAASGRSLASRVAPKLENFLTVPFPWAAQATILRLANGGGTTTAEISCPAA